MSKTISLLKKGNLSLISFAKQRYTNGLISKPAAIKILVEFKTQINVPIESLNISLDEKREYDLATKEVIKAVDDAIEFINTN